jgi:hypothetical protein
VSWARVRVNGQEKGLYSLIETYDSVFLADHYESTQVMYESDGSVGVGELGGFDVDEGPDDFGPLNGLADRLARTPFDGTSDLQRVFPEIDWRQIARINALEDILAHFDGDRGACHNFFLHLDGEGRWTLLPWSVDLSLVTNGFASGPLGSCMKLSVLCDADAQCRAWFLRDRDTAAQLALRGDWEARVTAWATPLAPFAKATNEPFRGNEFWPPDVGIDVVQNARDAVNLLRERAASIRCATAVARGEPAPGANETCGGFVLSSDQENRSGNLP